MVPNEDWASIPHEVTGAYTRKQGLRCTYEFFISVFPGSTGFRWTAEVWSEGQVKGTLHGMDYSATLPAAISSVHSMLHHCVENLIQIQE